ncbi:hypothetical protein PENSTE_c015G03337 [Penicillium steckii]|uniref:PrpF protein n=1 Tax=Penicillium steckii TaxID=303698 RepID=A0A1V6SZF2_9EURO|nr:hypothetical protein PENSTE_c015G03337 [Penicillium steckii]
MATGITMAIAEPPVTTHLKDNFKRDIVFPTKSPVKKSLPAVWMRSGTSKGLFIQRKDLPKSTQLWEPILLSAMGSVGADSRQIDGIGGATSTTSKVAVIEKSQRPSIDIEYTFIQVAPDQAKIDMTGNCGNIASGVGAFALDEGIVKAAPNQKEIDIRILNTNTGQTLVETVQVAADGSFLEDGDYSIPGVQGTSSRIKVSFLRPGGSMTGHIFPTGASQETLQVSSPSMGEFPVRVSLVDAANPFVLVDASSIPTQGHSIWSNAGHAEFLSMVEDIRRTGAVRFGLAPSLEIAGQTRGTPKIAFLYPSSQDDEEADIEVLSFTMGKCHNSLQLTGAVCLGAAMSIHGTVAWDLVRGKDNDVLPKHGMLVEGHEVASALPMGIRHPAGVIHAQTLLGIGGKGDVQVEQVAVFRTARRLFKGSVYYRA